MSLMPLPAQPAQTPWPTEAWPIGDLPDALDRARFDPLIAEAFGSPSGQLGKTHALLLVQGGRIVFEQYGEGFGPDDTQPSWSKAKSMTHALVGLLVGDDRLDIHAPAASFCGCRAG
jgi:CubicO group peptidase (beta-lactamase class C family)